jgi:hypothetical protein
MDIDVVVLAGNTIGFLKLLNSFDAIRRKGHILVQVV